MKCEYCGYYWKDDDEKFPHCHYNGPDEWCPCNMEEPTYETEDYDE
jgi:hypothetical protein